MLLPTALCAIHRFFLFFLLQLVESSEMHKLRISQFGAKPTYGHA